MGKRLLSAREAAAYLGLSHRTLWLWAQKGMIPVVRLRRRVLFDQVDLDAVIEACRQRPEAEDAEDSEDSEDSDQ